MKKTLILITALILSLCLAHAQDEPTAKRLASAGFKGPQPEYGHFFTMERLRLDLSLTGNKNSCIVSVNGLYREPRWSGSPNYLVDTTGYGSFYYEVFSSDTLIFSHGFNSLFEEWTTTAEASAVTKSGTQSICMPFPKGKVRVEITQWVRATGLHKPMLTFDIDPSDRHIVPGVQNDYPVKALIHNGDPFHKVDIVIVAEGYTASEMDKFEKDATKMMDYIFTMEPYSQRKNDFNVWLVGGASFESGISIPQKGIWKRTLLGSMYDTFYIDRYLTIMDHSAIARAAAGAPYDAIIVIANSSKYGGGGFYNSYAIGAADDPRSLPVFIHEFGHSFAALGDEYYTSDVAYEDYYPAGVEPWEANITTLVNFDSKWKNMIEDVPVPTPEDKQYEGKVGLFEGAGYMAKGCYRPYLECRMFNNTAPGFCPVCQREISRMIDRYVK